MATITIKYKVTNITPEDDGSAWVNMQPVDDDGNILGGSFSNQFMSGSVGASSFVEGHVYELNIAV